MFGHSDMVSIKEQVPTSPALITRGVDPVKITWVNKLPITRRGIYLSNWPKYCGPICPFCLQWGTRQIFDKYQKSSAYKRWDPFKITWVNKLPTTRIGIHIWITGQIAALTGNDLVWWRGKSGSFSVRSWRRWKYVELWDEEALFILIRYMGVTEFML